MRCKYDYVLFDLDGTLTQSAPGIKRCIELTLEKMGKPCPDLSDYSRYIGPPLIDTFRNLCKLSEEDAKVAFKTYLKLYDTEGEPLNKLFDGTREMLSSLREMGAMIAVCSSKHQQSVDKVCAFLGLTECFHALCGSDGTPCRKEKEDIIPYTLGVLGAKGDYSAVMIGDTHFDARGARIAKVDFVGVSFGYGDKTLMRNEGAEVFADSMEELLTLLTDNA